MNIFDDMPDIPVCPHCGHDGDGLSWAFPDGPKPFPKHVQCACLVCGNHGALRESYDAALEAWTAGEVEPAS